MAVESVKMVDVSRFRSRPIPSSQSALSSARLESMADKVLVAAGAVIVGAAKGSGVAEARARSWRAFSEASLVMEPAPSRLLFDERTVELAAGARVAVEELPPGRKADIEAVADVLLLLLIAVAALLTLEFELDAAVTTRPAAAGFGRNSPLVVSAPTERPSILFVAVVGPTDAFTGALDGAVGGWTALLAFLPTVPEDPVDDESAATVGRDAGGSTRDASPPVKGAEAEGLNPPICGRGRGRLSACRARITGTGGGGEK